MQAVLSVAREFGRLDDGSVDILLVAKRKKGRNNSKVRNKRAERKNKSREDDGEGVGSFQATRDMSLNNKKGKCTVQQQQQLRDARAMRERG